MATKATPYWDYIGLESLLSLQTGQTGQSGSGASEADLSNDEVMFIVVHQIDELWFKLVLREMVAVRDLFARSPVPEQALASAVRGVRRMETILRQLACHFELMETMTTRDYLSFRDKLAGASGFQSGQMREIEILMGLVETDRMPLGTAGTYLSALREHDGRDSLALRRVRARLEDKPTLRDSVLEWLYRTPIQGSTPSSADDRSRVRAFVESYLSRHSRAIERGLELARALGLPESDLVRREEHARREIAYARSYLLADEAREDERDRASRIRAALVFIECYRELPLLAWPREVIDGLTSFEQAFVIFRQRHARMVERMIGRRMGTGGSTGVDYLDSTAVKYRVFQELWAVRTILVSSRDLPALEEPEFYGFSSDEAV